ncbi:GNAT family N-acetyltransferase [Virgibacillus ndiopensis]|uniref:GNAT family N-acetyltransferase n=1 Tax=Virgibacillus ndiopensis TaxID=2004408 RepID=UPI000C074877|nr:GNAT family N-acetyltransferase [Virgibacillus ndiopensis]
MRVSLITQLKIIKITERYQIDAKNLILAGFNERFGFIDHSYNPDLNNIYTYYNKEGYAFFVGLHQDHVICTGALTKVRDEVGRIERMSVKKQYRRQGIAQRMLVHLENYAKKIGYPKLVLETNKEWDSAINLYINNGFIIDKQDKERVYLAKIL